jgi:cyclohexanone monooxygenase
MVPNTEVLDARWSDEQQRWIVTTTGAIYRARSFVIAAGPLHEPIIPDLPGLDSFAGEKFHSTRWPEHVDLTGKRVVVIGTGASAVQFVPAIQPHVAQMTVLQRTPSWVLPKADWTISDGEKRLLRTFPSLARVARVVMWGVMDAALTVTVRHPKCARVLSWFGRYNMRRAIKDRELRRKLTPEYATTCKRIGLSNDFYPALAQPNVEVITAAAAEIREHSVVTVDGREFPADVIIFGTGFQTLPHHPVNDRVSGRDGRTLAETWNGCPEAYLGTTMAGFPNAYYMFGPNIGTLSGFVMAEAQTDYLVGAITAMQDAGLSSIEVRAEAQAEFVAEVDKACEGTTFLAGCKSYYLDDNGRVALVWPWSMTRMRVRLARFDLAPYATRVSKGVESLR